MSHVSPPSGGSTSSSNPRTSNGQAPTSDEAALPPPPVAGRARWRDSVLKRLRTNRLLQITMAVALVCYGGALVLVVWHDGGTSRLDFRIGGTIVALSLASWSLLFWWYPVLERTVGAVGADSRGHAILRALEGIAVGCVVVVHVLLLFIILHSALA